MKKYQIIYADPPWEQRKGGLRKSRPYQTRMMPYTTLQIETIFEIIDQIRNQYTYTPHIFFIWTIDKFLHLCETEMLKRQYKLHARIIWDKENGIAPAFTIRYTHEYLLWFYERPMLKINPVMRGKLTDVIREKSTIHSKKPVKAYEMIETFYPTQNKIELFARNKREGWDVWGNEVESDIELGE